MDSEVAGIFQWGCCWKQGDWFAVGDVMVQLFCKLLCFRSAAVAAKSVLGVGGKCDIVRVIGWEAETFLLRLDALAVYDGCVRWYPCLKVLGTER